VNNPTDHTHPSLGFRQTLEYSIHKYPLISSIFMGCLSCFTHNDHPLTRDIMVKYGRYLMNIDEMRGRYWWFGYSSL